MTNSKKIKNKIGFSSKREAQTFYRHEIVYF